MSISLRSKKMSKDVKVPRKKALLYKFPKAIRKDEILQDTLKKQWRIGTSIGKGGFGEVYSAAEVGAKKSEYNYVIKIEPRENGPLYVETHFYMRVGKPEKINDWIKMKKLNYLGMPKLIGFGSHDYQNEQYRFVVMERYGQSIGNLFKQYKSFPLTTVIQLSYQIINILEYIHSEGYVHADIKGDNLLLGLKKNTENHVYLVDFGLAARHSTKTDFKPDPKKAHNGTIEFTSRDAHHGVTTMRGDLEILAYNIIYWLTAKLPWLDKLKDPKEVHKLKDKYMDKIPEFIKKCFTQDKPPNSLIEFLKYIKSLKFDSTPDYEFCRTIFKEEIKKNKITLNSPLIFANKSKKENASSRKRKPIPNIKDESEEEEENEEEEEEEEDNDEYFSDSEPEESKKRRKIRKNNKLSPPKIIKKSTKTKKTKEPPKFLNCLALQNSQKLIHPDFLKTQNKK